AGGSVDSDYSTTATFTPDPDFTGVAELIYTVTDGHTFRTAQIKINVSAPDDPTVNNAPVNHVPASQAATEDTPLVFGVAGGNAISISDPDSGAGSMVVDLAVAHGTLTLAGTANLAVGGDGTALLHIVGTVADINAALD